MITHLKDNQIFVFGSNTAGRHMGGAARQALTWGAIMGRPFGPQGRTFAIPTIDAEGGRFEPLPLHRIAFYVDRFLDMAYATPQFEYLVTEVGCGIAGYTPRQVAPLFARGLHMDNVILPKSFLQNLNV